MMVIASIFTLGILLFLFRVKTNHYPIEVKTHRVAKILTRIIMLSPVIGCIVFAVLFSTALRGRLIARSSHAFIVFILWMYATTFYVEMLKHIRHKLLLLLSILGMAGSIVLAIMLTPLDRYCNLVNLSLYIPIYVLCIFSLGFIYAGQLLLKRSHSC